VETLTKHFTTKYFFLLLLSLLTLNTAFASSVACNLAVTTNVRCDNNGTPSDPKDDKFFVDLSATGTGGFGYDVFTANWATKIGWQDFGKGLTFGPYNISSGSVTFVVAINGDANCNKVVTIAPPAPCSVAPKCDLAVSTKVRCDNNGTPSDPKDDKFFVDLSATGTGGFGYDVFTANWAAKIGWQDFGKGLTFGPYNISSGSVTFVVAVNGDASCNKVVTVAPPAPCSTAPAVAKCDLQFKVHNARIDNKGQLFFDVTVREVVTNNLPILL
jgi:hypothetical protein